MFIHFKNSNNTLTETELAKMAEETIQFLCERIERLGNGINSKILHRAYIKIGDKLQDVTFQSDIKPL